MRSYCSDPVCAATRSSWATGLYTSETGVPFNGGYMHGGIPDVGQVLSTNGYAAFHCGKWHVPGRNVRESFNTLYYGKRDIGAGGGEYYDSASTHAVTDFLTTYGGSAPFYLQIGYLNPHDVCEYLHNHEEKRVPNPLQQGIVPEEELPPLPENFHYDESETVLQQVCRRTDDALIHAPILNGIRDWDEFHWRYLIWNYYRFIEKVDAEIGVVLNTLEGIPFCDNTVIIFSADHGEACGSHQMFQKFTLYEESIRVPFIVACLGGGVPVQKNHFDREHFISGVDLVPTVYDYAGIDGAEAAQVNRSDVPGLGGVSVRPLAEGDDIPWREHAYVESNYWGRAVVGDRYKYITEYKPADPEDFRPPGPDASRLGRAQLFDLQTDPWETQNLVSQPGYEDAIDSCRANLLAQEAKLNRRQIEHPNPRNVISNWGDSLRAYWEGLSAS